MSQPSWQEHFKFLSQGAIVQEFQIGGKNIVLGFDSAARYETDESPFFGETIGRCANRLANARINSLNGRSYQLKANNGPNTLHGGKQGWGKRRFDGPHNVTKAGREAVHFTYRSLDGEEGFPGTVELKVWYFPTVSESDGKQIVSLEMEYEAELVGDEVEETVINVCNHGYFNITDGPTVAGTIVKLGTTLHQVTDQNDIPTGSIEPFPGITTEAFTLGEQDPDIDHCFVINNEPRKIPIDTRDLPLQQLVEMRHVQNKLQLSVHSTEPAFQFYTGKYINVPSMDGQPAMGPRSGLCVEASRYVNAVNDDRWREMVVLRRGERYGSRTIYIASQL